MRIEAVCWDWNGTLLDDGEICRATMNRVLAGRGLDTFDTLQSYRRSFRFPIREFYRGCGIADEDFTDAADEYLALLDLAVGDARLHPGALEVIEALHDRGVTQVLASATLRTALEAQLRPHGIADRFDRVLSIEDAYAASKADVIAAWLADSGLPPGRVLMIGDTNHDSEIAAVLGTQFVHFASGHQYQADPSAQISALNELLPLISKRGLEATTS